MAHALAAVSLYSALVAQIALGDDVLGVWTPNLLLLAGLVAARGSGIAWAAAAGLLCDGLSGRPLGVTMLVATLAVTVARHLVRPVFPSHGLGGVAQTFAVVSVIDAASRLLAATAESGSGAAVSLSASLRAAAATALVPCAALAAGRSFGTVWSALARGGRPGPPLWSASHRTAL